MDARDLVRNDLAYANPTLFARDLGSASCRLAVAYPGRMLLRYEWSTAAGHGALTPIHCGPPRGGRTP
jgi:hypothetical protein